jgi:hypothetical protein
MLDPLEHLGSHPSIQLEAQFLFGTCRLQAQTHCNERTDIPAYSPCHSSPSRVQVSVSRKDGWLQEVGVAPA